MTTEKEKMMDALSVFIRQRAGLEFGNYGDLQSYRQEQRSITKDRHQAFELFRFICRSESITAERIKAEARNRLEWKNDKWEYTTGQYFPTEYRRAVCNMLSAVLWNWFREECQCETREKIQASAKREFSRAVAKRWFRWSASPFTPDPVLSSAVLWNAAKPKCGGSFTASKNM